MRQNRLSFWESQFERFVEAQETQDGAHDIDHVRRVVSNAKWLAEQEQARLDIVVPAAWLHDCVVVNKLSPLRPQASRIAAKQAAAYLNEIGYPPSLVTPITHAIESHSFSAGIEPQTVEAKVVQDADRLDALGAIGIARCLMTGAQLGLPLYDPAEPLPVKRAPDDRRAIIDHFYTKLLGLAQKMQTAAGRAEGVRRTEIMIYFLNQLGAEAGA